MDIKRNPQIGASDWLLRLDDGSAMTFDSEQEARTAMAAIEASEQPVEIEFVGHIVELMRTLRASYNTMIAMQVEWQGDQFQEALATAATEGTLLAGYPAIWWQEKGAMLQLLQQWLDTPQEQLAGRTPKSILIARNIATVQP